jgi:hypothetical protein
MYFAFPSMFCINLFRMTMPWCIRKHSTESRDVADVGNAIRAFRVAGLIYLEIWQIYREI